MQNKNVRYYCFVVLITLYISICFFPGCHSCTTAISEKTEDYLVADTPFNVAAKMVMPEKALINETTEYFYVRTNYFEGIRLVLSMSEEEYTNAVSSIRNNLENMTIEISGRPYYFREDTEGMECNGSRFRCFTFIVDGKDYAVAYSTSEAAKTIECIFFSAYELSTMTVRDALCTADDGYITSFYGLRKP